MVKKVWRTDTQTDGQTDWTSHIAAWSQLKMASRMIQVQNWFIGSLHAYSMSSDVGFGRVQRKWNVQPKMTYNCELRMRQECRERFPCHRLPRKQLVNAPGMHHGKCVTHVLWCMSGSLTRGGGENSSRHSRRMRNPQFYLSGKKPMINVWIHVIGSLSAYSTRMWNMISSPATPTVCLEQKSDHFQSRNVTLSMPSQSQKKLYLR